MYTRWLVIVGALLASMTAAGAEPRAVKLADVIAATSTAPAAAIPAHEVAAADALVDAAGAWPAPSVRAQTNRLTARFVTGIAMTLPVLGSATAPARQEAAANAQVARRDAVVQRRDLQRRAVLAWIGLARSDAEVEVRATAATQASELEQLARGKKDAGAGAEVDVVTAGAARARAEVALAAARRAQEAAAAGLAGILGWDPAQAIRSEGALPAGTAHSLDVAGVITRHPESLAAQSRIGVADAEIAKAQVLGRPSIGLEVQASFQDPTTPGTDILGGVTLDLPIFAHAGDHERAARASREAARSRLATTNALLAGELVAARRRWEAAAATVAALERDVLPAQIRATTLARQAFREGARDLATALQADRDLAGVRAELAGARADLAAAWIELQLAAGEEPGGGDAR